VILTRLRARTELPGHRCAIRDDRLADYKVCAGIVEGHPAYKDPTHFFPRLPQRAYKPVKG